MSDQVTRRQFSANTNEKNIIPPDRRDLSLVVSLLVCNFSIGHEARFSLNARIRIFIYSVFRPCGWNDIN